MVYTLGEAAKAAGKSKATISKAIKSGRLSAYRKETGVFSIEASELHRVYPLNVENEQDRTLSFALETPEKQHQISELRARLEAADERLSDRDAMIADLREDRDRWRQQATGLLADLRSKPQPEPQPKGFWKRLFG